MEDSSIAKAIKAEDGATAIELLNAIVETESPDAPGRLVGTDGKTLFHIAAKHMPENGEVLKALVAKGVNPAARDHQGESGMDVLLASSADAGAERVAEAVLRPLLEQQDLEGLERLAMAGWMLSKCSPTPDQLEDKMGAVPEAAKLKLAELVEAQSKQAAISQCIREGSGPVDSAHVSQLGGLLSAHMQDGLTLLHHAVVYENTEATKTILATPDADQSVNVLDYMKRSPLHYAAMCPPGTEIYQALKNAGADENLLDVMGKSPLDYAAEPNETMLAEIRDRIEQRLGLKAKEETSLPAAVEAKPEETSGEQTAEQADEKQGDTQEEQAQEQEPVAAEIKVPAGPKEIKPVEMYVSQRNIRREPPVPPPSTVDGRYIAQHLGEALTRALAEIAEVRPWDPIEYLARWLHKYRRDEAFSRKQEELLKTIRDEEARLVREEELKFKRMEELRRYQEEEAEKKRIEEEERKKREQEELLRNAKESALAQKPALPTVSEEGEEGAQEDEDDDGEEDDDPAVKDRDKTGQTELHKLAAQPGVDFTALIQLGYSIADRDLSGKTARDIAHDNGQQETVQAIDNYLKKMLEDGREDVLEQLVLEGFDGLDSVDRENLPEVTKAALDRLSGLKDAIASTMKSAATRDKEGEAEAQEAVDTQPLLVRAKDEAGRSLLHLAVLAGADKLVTHLVTNFPDILKARDNCNRTSLHYAWGTSPELAELLISKGASAKARDAMKKKPAYYKNNSADIRAIQASLGLRPVMPPVPEVTIGEVDHAQEQQAQDQDETQTEGENAADDQEQQHLATVMAADIPPQEKQEEQQAAA